MPPSEAMYRAVFEAIETAVKPTQIYEYAPEEGTKYPFVWLDREETPITPNSDLMGEYRLGVRIYGLLTDRKRLNELNGKIYDALFELRKAYNYRMNLRTYSTNKIKENDKGTPLLHVSSDVLFYWNKGEDI